jgi:hypothetical protein
VSAPTAAERIAAVQAKRAALQATEKAAFDEQQATDLEALVALEEEHGFDRVLRVDVGGWKPGTGATTLMAARIPLASESYYKRFEQTVAKAKDGTTVKVEAGYTLARACLVYPSEKGEPELYKATVDIAPGILSHLAHQIVKAVQGQAEEEKKG